MDGSDSGLPVGTQYTSCYGCAIFDSCSKKIQKIKNSEGQEFDYNRTKAPGSDDGLYASGSGIIKGTVELSKVSKDD